MIWNDYNQSDHIPTLWQAWNLRFTLSMISSHPSATAFMVESPQRTSPVVPKTVQLDILSSRVILRVLCLESLILQSTLSTNMVLVNVVLDKLGREEESRPVLCNGGSGDESSCRINLAWFCQFRLKDISTTMSSCDLFLTALRSWWHSAQKCPLHSSFDTISQAGHGSSVALRTRYGCAESYFGV